MNDMGCGDGDESVKVSSGGWAEVSHLPQREQLSSFKATHVCWVLWVVCEPSGCMPRGRMGGQGEGVGDGEFGRVLGSISACVSSVGVTWRVRGAMLHTH